VHNAFPAVFNPITRQEHPRLSDLAWETVFNARFTAGECKRNNLLSLAMSAEERLGRITGPRLDPDQSTAASRYSG
jgi:hypothetical protein